MSAGKRHSIAGLVLLTCVLALPACTQPDQTGTPSAGGKPMVSIVAPAAGTPVTPGETVTIQALAEDAQGVARVELWVDNRLIEAQDLAQPTPTYQVTFTWMVTTPGRHAWLVRVYNTAGMSSDSALVSVQVAPAGTATVVARPSATPAPTATALPTGTPTLEPTYVPGSVTVRVAPDGSGDYPSLEAAVDAMPAGATIMLAPGAHRLPKPLDIATPLRLVGAGMDQTFVVGTTGGYVVQFIGPGAFAAQEITFRCEGTAPSNGMVVQDGDVDLYRCRFTGAVRYEAEKKGGTGLWLRGSTTGRVRECQADGNELHGISVSDESPPTLERNICQDNRQNGITYFDHTGGVARQNECTGNGYYGFSVNEQSQPTLEGNACVGNRYHGIGIHGQAQPALEANVCQNNGQSGIVYFDDAGGTARRNQCRGNGYHGIGVNGQGQPLLEGNICQENQQSGIRYSDSANGTARQNQCTGNGYHGIDINDQAQPTVEVNICKNNGQSGIVYFESAGGTARQNECVGNARHGISVDEQAHPTLAGNICTNNKQCGIRYADRAGGIARQNECTGNQWGIYVAATADPTLEDNRCHGNSRADIDDQRA